MGKRRVIFDNDRKRNIRRNEHEGLGDHPKAKVLAPQRGLESIYQKFAEQFYQYSMVEDVKKCIKNCQNCQQQENIFRMISPELQSILIPSEVLK